MCIRFDNDRLLLHHRSPQLGVAHQSHVENGVALMDKLILTEHPDPQSLGNGNRSLAGFQVVTQDPKERRLTGTVGTHQSVTLPCIELKRHTGEESPVTEGLGEIGCGNHGEGM